MEDRTTVMVQKHPMQTEAVSERTEVCEKCGETLTVGAWPFCPHPGNVSLVSSKIYPYTTRHISGQPMEITSAAHERAVFAAHGIRQRDDAAFLNKEYLGYNWKTKQQEYKEGNGVGMPGCWV